MKAAKKHNRNPIKGVPWVMAGYFDKDGMVVTAKVRRIISTWTLNWDYDEIRYTEKDPRKIRRWHRKLLKYLQENLTMV